MAAALLLLAPLLLSSAAAVAAAAAAPTAGGAAAAGGECRQCGGRQSATSRDHALIQFKGAFLRASTPEKIHSGGSITLTAHTGSKVAVRGLEVDASGTATEEQQTLVVERKSGGGGAISSGDEVVLKAYTGKYISVNASEVFAKWTNRGGWETFIVERAEGPGVVRPGDSISLLAHTGRYVTVNQSAVFAKWSHSHTWERFVVQRAATSAHLVHDHEFTEGIKFIDSVTLTAHTGAKVGVHGSEVEASGTGTEEQQTLIMERKWQNSWRPISSGEEVVLKAYTGKYISVNASDVFAKWNHRGGWETFVVERTAGPGIIQSGDSISLLAHTGRYLTVNHSAVFAKWTHSHSWERFVVRKAAPAAGPSSATASPEPAPTPGPTAPEDAPETADFPGSWASEHGHCDPEINCYRLLTVTCKSSTGEDLSSSECDPSTRPPSWERCHLLGRDPKKGICVDIAPSDCVDVPGCWWNPWRLTCGELAGAGACEGKGEGVQLEGFSERDAKRTRKLCPVSCSQCVTVAAAPDHAGTQQCEADACEDDPGFSGHSELGVVIGSSCSMIQGGDCNTFANADELKRACPKSCGLC